MSSELLTADEIEQLKDFYTLDVKTVVGTRAVSREERRRPFETVRVQNSLL